MIEGIIGVIGVLIGSAITYYSQYKTQLQELKFKEKSTIKNLKLEKYELVLEDIRNEIRHYSTVYGSISKILDLYDLDKLRGENLISEINLIDIESNYHCTNLYRYGFLFGVDNIDNFIDSDLRAKYLMLLTDVLSKINMESVKDEDFRWNVTHLRFMAKDLSLKYVEVSDKVKDSVADIFDFERK